MKLPVGRNLKRPSDESGQSIVLIALLIIGLIAFAGIATDVGMLFARSSQFTAAVDAAALAGIVDLGDGVDAAIIRSAEFLAANRWPIAACDPTDPAQQPCWEFAGSDGSVVFASGAITGTESTTGRGYPEFTLTATWPVETYFLRVLGFEQIAVTRSAAAALYSQMDMPTATQAELGMLRTAGQFINGPDSCTAQGDPVSAKWIEPGRVNPLRDFTGGGYTYRIQIPDDFTGDLAVQLFDPDSLNLGMGASSEFERPDGTTGTGTCPTSGEGDSCMIITGEGSSSNPVWLHRVDEVWLPSVGCPERAATNPNGNTVTAYSLYYYDSAEERQDIVRFTTGGIVDQYTDLNWVTPGESDPDLPLLDFTGHITPAITSSFVITPGLLTSIPQDGSNNVSVYLDVEAIAGTSKNGWDVWAGPADVANGLPNDGNDRNLEILRNINDANTGGVEIFAQGYLPASSYLFDPLTLPLAAVSAAEGGGTLYATVFDFEAPASGPFQFSFSTMSMQDRPADLAVPRTPTCSGDDCNNNWVEPQIPLDIPSSNPLDHGYGPATPCPTPPPNVCVAFYGGYLTVDYTMNADEHVWSVSLAGGRPFLTR